MKPRFSGKKGKFGCEGGPLSERYSKGLSNPLRTGTFVILVTTFVFLLNAGCQMPRSQTRAESIQCANNLCRLGFAAKNYALDYGETYAPDISSMSNEISTPKILVCPSDKSKRPALSFSERLSPTNVTYEYLMSGLKGGFPQQAVFRCPIHRYVVLEDCSVVLRDGTIQRGKVVP
jgi:hypothetical protein